MTESEAIDMIDNVVATLPTATNDDLCDIIASFLDELGYSDVVKAWAIAAQKLYIQ